MSYLTDAEIVEIIEPYIYDFKTDLFEFLTEDMVPPEYRVIPKNKKLYRGIQIPHDRYLQARSADDPIQIGGKYYQSYSSSRNSAYDFARGLGGNDYDYRDSSSPRALRERRSVTRIGLVFERALPDNSRVVLAIGTFLRRANLPPSQCDIRKMCHENEWLLRQRSGDSTIRKRDIVAVTKPA